MDDKSISDMNTSSESAETKKIPSQPEEGLEVQAQLLSGALKAAAGPSAEPVETAVNEFLEGKGALLELAQSALTRSKSSAVDEVAAFLTTKFKLPAVIAQLVAARLVKLIPSLKKKAKKKTAAKKKTTSKAKPKTTAKAKSKAGAKTKKKKETSSAVKAAAKKKPAAKAKKKAAASKAKPKKAAGSTSSKK